MSNDSITRVPIHRHPIQQQYCSCHGIKSLGVNGVTRFFIADGISADVLDNFLGENDIHTPVYISEPLNLCLDKIQVLSNRGIPLILLTHEIIGKDILSLLSCLPHSSIQVSIDFLRENPMSSLEDHLSAFQSFREMMSLAKAWKISTGVCLGYQPVIVNRFDMYDIIQSIRPTVSNMTIYFPEVSCEYQKTDTWMELYQSYSNAVNKNYVKNNETGSLEINPVSKKEILKELSFFLKSRKIVLDEMNLEFDKEDMRIRHNPSYEGVNPFGVRLIPRVNGDHDTAGQLKPEAHICKDCHKPFI